jgi:hypothetical protein
MSSLSLVLEDQHRAELLPVAQLSDVLLDSRIVEWRGLQTARSQHVVAAACLERPLTARLVALRTG